MKAAAVALVCVLRFAVPALASEPSRPGPPARSPAIAAPIVVTPIVVTPIVVTPVVVAPVVGTPPIVTPVIVTPANATPVVLPPAPKPALGTAIKEPLREQAKPRAEAPRRPRVCLGPSETRETVAAHRLTEPFRALRVGRQQGEALRAKLCRWRKDEFVYEISVLRRDGRILHLYMNAQSGQSVGALDDTDRH